MVIIKVKTMGYAKPRVRRSNGAIEEIMPHEVVLDADSKPIDPDRFADRGHFDFLPGFDPRGAANLRP